MNSWQEAIRNMLARRAKEALVGPKHYGEKSPLTQTPPEKVGRAPISPNKILRGKTKYK